MTKASWDQGAKLGASLVGGGGGASLVGAAGFLTLIGLAEAVVLTEATDVDDPLRRCKVSAREDVEAPERIRFDDGSTMVA